MDDVTPEVCSDRPTPTRSRLRLRTGRRRTGQGSGASPTQGTPPGTALNPDASLVEQAQQYLFLKRVRSAYFGKGKLILPIATVFATLTFARRGTGLAAAYLALVWLIRRIEDRTGTPPSWFACFEPQADGTIHIHVILAGVPVELLPEIKRLWTKGNGKIEAFDPERSAVSYLTKWVTRGAAIHWGGPRYRRRTRRGKRGGRKHRRPLAGDAMLRPE